MIENTIVSIVMPVYNAERYLSEAIDSILLQSLTNWELILVDDGSTDRSLEIAKSYIDPRIRIIPSTHDYIHSLNTGIQAVQGKYIARMDADDIMLPHRLQTQLDFMELHPQIDICGSWAETFGVETRIMQVATEHEQIAPALLLHNSMIHPSVFMRRTITEHSSIGLYKHDYPCAEDYKLWTDLAIQEFRFANIPETLLRYRRSEEQVTNVRWKEMVASSGKIQMEYAQEVMEQIAGKEERYEIFFNELIRLHNESIISRENLLRIVYQIYHENKNEKSDNLHLNSSFEITDRGIWINDNLGGHCFDSELSKAIIQLLRKYEVKTAVDMGCGPGWYVKSLLDSGFEAEGYDGNPFTEEIAKKTTGNGGNCKQLDLTQDITFDAPFDMVISLEVGEHIPIKYESIFIKNLVQNSKKYILLSWAVEGQTGDGHVNCRNNDYIVKKMSEKGFIEKAEISQFLRCSAELVWFKDSILFFEKI